MAGCAASVRGAACTEADSCVDVAECTATCADISAICGTICGEVCGECVAEQEYCSSCQCIPSCAGKACGDDGAAAHSGTCGADEVATTWGNASASPPATVNNAAPMQRLCGSCGADEVCGDDGQCTEAPCVPACLGKTAETTGAEHCGEC